MFKWIKGAISPTPPRVGSIWVYKNELAAYNYWVNNKTEPERSWTIVYKVVDAGPSEVVCKYYWAEGDLPQYSKTFSTFNTRAFLRNFIKVEE